MHDPPEHDRDRDPQIATLATPRRPILLGLALALAVTLGFLALVAVTRPSAGSGDTIAKDAPAPRIAGTTLDGAGFDLTTLRGKPVVVNFWGPSCVPCRNEFPLFERMLAAHAADGLNVVGVLMDDPPEPARDFVAEYKAPWPTVVDPNKSIKDRYRVAFRPQTYFIDRAGVVRSIQYGEVTEPDFERQYALISR
ncbi:MAG: TlpA family protein disulfide reductase [Chloroflexota bacterium]